MEQAQQLNVQVVIDTLSEDLRQKTVENAILKAQLQGLQAQLDEAQAKDAEVSE